MASLVHSKIFWPLRGHESPPSGYIVGWNIRSFIGCVATVISGVELSHLQQILQSLKEEKVVPSSLVVLGEWINNDNASSSSSTNTESFNTSLESIWFIVEKDRISRLPLLRKIYCYGYRYGSHTSSQIILYSPPTDNKFFSADPLSFGDYNVVTTDSLNFEIGSVNSHLTAASGFNSSRLPHEVPNSTSAESELEETLRQINHSLQVEEAIHHRIKDLERKVEKKHEQPYLLPLDQKILGIFLGIFMWLHGPSSLLLHLLNFNLGGGSLFSSGKVKDFSCVAQQLDWRLKKMEEVADRGKELEHHYSKTADNRVQYINLYNTIWLILIDLLLGFVFGYLLIAYSTQVLSVMHHLNDILTNNVLKSQISWLMGWPAGFKLNGDLDRFLGTVFLFYIDRWIAIVNILSPYEPLVIKGIALLGFLGGLSCIITAIVDVISFLTLHITCFYTASARIYYLQLNVLSSLWKLFRGMKNNPLKQRIDTCDFDIDQLLLGTLLFTLIFFLLPTTAIYCFFFIQVRVLLLLLRAFFFFILELLNHFPLYAVFTYFKNNNLLPGGIRFEIHDNQSATQQPSLLQLSHKRGPSNPKRMFSTYLLLSNRGIPFSSIFNKLATRFRLLMKTYSPMKCIKCFLTGEPFVT